MGFVLRREIMTPELRRKIQQRSGGRCEAEIKVRLQWQRCAAPATEIHHLLTKGRGGRNLDRVGETYHLIHLCSECHRASVGSLAYEGGMLIDGSVTWDRLIDRPIYSGQDQYLLEKYGTTSGS